MLRWIWSISKCNLTNRDSRKWTPMGGPSLRERRGSGPEKQQPKHNPCRRSQLYWQLIYLSKTKTYYKPNDLLNNACDWCKPDHVTLSAGKIRHLLTVCLTKVHMIGWNPNGIPTRSMENMRWYSPSQVLTAKHVPYPQLTAT